jgi:hypothetical protein
VAVSEPDSIHLNTLDGNNFWFISLSLCVFWYIGGGPRLARRRFVYLYVAPLYSVGIYFLGSMNPRNLFHPDRPSGDRCPTLDNSSPAKKRCSGIFKVEKPQQPNLQCWINFVKSQNMNFTDFSNSRNLNKNEFAICPNSVKTKNKLF